jgi:Cu(I)/Ag(I) efflux system membrane fusion protein
MSDDTTLLAPAAADPVPKPTPPARPRWPLFVLGVLVGSIGVVLAGVFLFSGVLTGLLPPVFRPPGGTPAPTAAATATQAPRYHCPMHPTYTSDRPGDCPICGMKLVPIEGDAAAGHADHATAATATAADPDAEDLQCPKHPTHTAPEPGTCIVCGEKLVPVPGSKASVPEDAKGLAGVAIDAERRQLIGLRTTEVTLGSVGRMWRTSGRVVVDETRVHKVNVKVEGFVEKLHVDFIGRPVKRGEALLEMYSPEVMAAQYELLLAARTEKALDTVALGNAALGNEPGGAPGLLEPARQKLRLWDVPSGAIARVERTGQVARTVTLSSPIAGVVTAKTVVQGSRMLPGDTPFEITDLSHVWVLADVYAGEIALVEKGQPATLWLQGRPDRPFQGGVEFLDPLVDEKTRTVRVRLQFPSSIPAPRRWCSWRCRAAGSRPRWCRRHPLPVTASR